MWTLLASFLGGPVVNGLINAYKAKLEAANMQGAQAADLAAKAIAAEIEARNSAQAIIIAEQGRWWTALPRALVQWSFAVFVVKCVVWDTVLGLGITEPLGGDIQDWAGWVMALWFGGRSLEKIATVIWRGK
jgi:hypothetical protein